MSERESQYERLSELSRVKFESREMSVIDLPPPRLSELSFIRFPSGVMLDRDSTPGSISKMRFVSFSKILRSVIG
jgi:hypothetical protein